MARRGKLQNTNDGKKDSRGWGRRGEGTAKNRLSKYLLHIVTFMINIFKRRCFSHVNVCLSVCCPEIKKIATSEKFRGKNRRLKVAAAKSMAENGNFLSITLNIWNRNLLCKIPSQKVSRAPWIVECGIDEKVRA